MLTVVAFVLIVGFFGTGPFFVGAQATCSGDNNNNISDRSERSISQCDLEQVQQMMREKKLPKELKARAHSPLVLSKPKTRVDDAFVGVEVC